MLLLFFSFLLPFLVLQLADFGLDLRLELVRSPLELVQHLADLTCNPRQFLRPEEQQGENEQYDRVRKTHQVIITDWLQGRQRGGLELERFRIKGCDSNGRVKGWNASQNQMKEITISEFRTRLHAILKAVQKRKQPLRITRYGKPMAEIRPAARDPHPNLMGFMKDKMEIVGDILTPAGDPDDWEVLRD